MHDIYPVAVQVKPVVVAASTRPAFRMFAVEAAVVDVTDAPVGIDPFGETFLSVGIAYGVDEENAAGELLFHLSGLCGNQIVGRKERRFGAGRFIAVHAVTQKQNKRRFGRFLLATIALLACKLCFASLLDCYICVARLPA